MFTTFFLGPNVIAFIAMTFFLGLVLGYNIGKRVK